MHFLREREGFSTVTGNVGSRPNVDSAVNSKTMKSTKPTTTIPKVGFVLVLARAGRTQVVVVMVVVRESCR